MDTTQTLTNEGVEEFLAQGFGECRLGAGSQAVNRVSRMSVGSMTLDDVELGCSVSFGMERFDVTCMTVVTRGSMTVRRLRGVSVTPGEACLVEQSSVPLNGTLRGTHYTTIALDPEIVRDTAPVGARHRRPVQFTSHKPLSPEAGHMVTQVLRAVQSNVFANPGVHTAPLVLSHAAQFLAAAMLAAVPNTAMESEWTLTDCRDARRTTFEAAVSFIEDNAHRDITLADIATAARVTPRAVQHAFARQGEPSPLAYLRRLRLALAHADLRAARPEAGETVGCIAARWGFSHRGRFAAAYRAVYGVHPEATLGNR
ncbi:helix-turn-helix transcriptional regulator [Streptomyces sp. NPDC047023]|uniref:helix-turn-helix transcriptional regulator n=1 Tax=Streptomyces sp. NPDC047023 TaxID=3155139 RepID=UPI0033CA4CE0